jgi:hypothetical protein
VCGVSYLSRRDHSDCASLQQGRFTRTVYLQMLHCGNLALRYFKNIVFWASTACSSIKVFRRFGGTSWGPKSKLSKQTRQQTKLWLCLLLNSCYLLSWLALRQRRCDVVRSSWNVVILYQTGRNIDILTWECVKVKLRLPHAYFKYHGMKTYGGGESSMLF